MYIITDMEVHLHVKHNEDTGLYMTSLGSISIESLPKLTMQHEQSSMVIQKLNNVYVLGSKKEIIWYYHWCAFPHTIVSWIESMGICFLTYGLV